MLCPYCKSNGAKVYTSVQICKKDEDMVKRYRKCRVCGESFSTIERCVEVRRGRRRKHEQTADRKAL